ncbi:DUF2231 domain-containing protein [Tatumella saanichensis]|uniref:DUF2231 domain-containing protein n=1 Tax=Tatumella saanichensis TaxID=480813 RepID=UPI0004A23A1A|nr:DUF2231 domain-containing protein [Tatumella saanichensis]
MSLSVYSARLSVAQGIYQLLNPIPYGFFVGAMIFDIITLYSPEVLWQKSASWLITLGLIFAIIPRLINLVQVCRGPRRSALSADRLGFWFNLLAIVAAIANAFVHSRDAYAIVPENAMLSVITVIFLVIAVLVAATSSLTLTGGRQ